MSETSSSSAVDAVLELQRALEALPSTARLTQSDCDAIYALAHQLIVQNRFETAFQYFSLLTLYRPTHVTYLQGLALTYRMMERYDEALSVYSFIATIDPTNLDHSMAIVECLLLKRDYEEAKETVATLLRYCKENAVAGKVGDRAQALLDLLSPPDGALPA